MSSLDNGTATEFVELQDITCKKKYPDGGTSISIGNTFFN